MLDVRAARDLLVVEHDGDEARGGVLELPVVDDSARLLVEAHDFCSPKADGDAQRHGATVKQDAECARVELRAGRV